MEQQKRRDTTPEVALRSALHKRGLRFRIEAAIVPGSRRRVDVVFPAPKVAVFVDGCFWHGCPTHGTMPKTNTEWWREKLDLNRKRDRDTDARLRASGWEVVRVWEHEHPQDAADRVAAVVRRRQPLERKVDETSHAELRGTRRSRTWPLVRTDEGSNLSHSALAAPSKVE